MSLAAVTLHRQAVTLPESSEHTPRDEYAAIVAEIAERLCELDELKRDSHADLMQQLGDIARTSRRGFRITVQLLHGASEELLSSYQDQADARGVTKQDVHWEFTHEINRFARWYPELFACSRGVRAQAMAHEDPRSRYEVAAANHDGGAG